MDQITPLENIKSRINVEKKRLSTLPRRPVSQILPETVVKLAATRKWNVSRIVKRIWGARNSPRFFLGMAFRIPVLGVILKWLSNVFLINKRLRQIEEDTLKLQELLVKTESQIIIRVANREEFLIRKINEIESKMGPRK